MNGIGTLEGRVIALQESFEFERGVHYFSILRSMHAADTHPSHLDKNLMKLKEELESDPKDLSQLREALSILF